MVLYTYLHEAITFEELIPLRAESGARLLASTTDISRVWSMSHESVSTLWLLAYPLGMLRLDVSVTRLASDRTLMDAAASQTSARGLTASAVQPDHVTAHIRSLLEQAIFYGAQSENPVAFEISNEAAKDFSEAAVSLSNAVVHAGMIRHLNRVSIHSRPFILPFVAL
jgi:hypothetical protein